MLNKECELEKLKSIWEKVKSVFIKLNTFDLQGLYWSIGGILVLSTSDNNSIIGFIFIAVSLILLNLGTLYRTIQKNQEEILEKLSKDK